MQNRSPHFSVRRFLFYICCALTAAASCQIPTSGLINAWTFSGNANDGVGTNHGTVLNATLTADRCGNPNSAYTFSGSGRITTTQLGPTGYASRTLSFWARTSNTVINSPVSAFEYGRRTNNADSYEIVWNYCTQGVGMDISTQALIRGNSCLLDNRWHHIAVVYDSAVSVSFSNVAYYVDGVVLPSVLCNQSGQNGTVNTGTVFPITLGADVIGTRNWKGDLDDFYLYNRALSAQEVLQLYNIVPCKPPIFGNTVICAGSTNIYSVSPYSNATYTWTLPNGWTGTSSTNTISAVAGMSSGTITVAASSSCGVLPTSTLSVVSALVNSLSVNSSNPFECTGKTVTLTASGATSYTWLPGFSTATSLIVSPNATSTYTLLAGANNCSASIIFTQVINQSPTIALVSPTMASCVGGSVVITASGASTYTWLPGISTGSQITVNVFGSTVFTVTGTSASGCTATATRFIATPPALSLNVTANSATACVGQNLSLSANAAGGTPAYMYSWAGGPFTSVKNITSATAGAQVNTVNVMDANFCSITRTISVTFVANPTISVASVSICPNTNGTLTATGAANYTWLPNNSNGNTLVDNPAVTTSYSVTGSSLGCSATAVASLVIKPAPLLTFVTTSINCAYLGSGTVTANGGIGPFSFTWVPTNQTGSVASGLYPGAYTVTVFDQGTGCKYPLTTTFTPLVPLSGTVSATGSVLCHGATTASASILLENGSGNQSYLWTSPPGSTQTSSNPVSLAAGVNTIHVVDALTYCQLTHTFFVYQPPALSIVFTPPTASVCIGDSITFSGTASGGVGGYSYVWSPAGNINTLTAKENLSGTHQYSLTVTDTNNCAFTSTVAGKFVDNPTVTVISDSICPLNNATLVASGASTYSWSSGFPANPLVTSPPATSVYIVVGTALGCTSSATGTITVKPLPVPVVSVQSTYCQNDTVRLIGSGGASFFWSGPQGFNSTLASPFLALAQMTNSGTYQLKVTGVNGCTASASTPVTINPVPIFVAGGSTVCAGSALTLNSSFVSGGSYLWTGPGTSTAVQNPVFTNAIPSMSGLYELKVTTAKGCTNVATVHASVVTKPAINIAADSIICFADSSVMIASGGNSYTWQGPGGFYGGSSLAVISNASFINSGQYTVTSAFGPCTAYAYKNVTVVPLPQPVVSGNLQACENSALQISSSAASSFTWTGNNILQFGSVMNISPIDITHAGTYTLSVKDDNGCQGKKHFSVTVLPAPEISASNASVCLGGALTLTASGGDVYYWTGPQSFTANGSAVGITNINAGKIGTYHVLVTSANGCSSSKSINVSGFAYQLPSVSISGNNRVCINSLVTLGGSGGVTYRWDGPNGFTSTLQSVSFTANDSLVEGVYTLTVKNESLCSGSQTVALKLLPLPQATLNQASGGCVPFCTQISLREKNDSSDLTASHFQMGLESFNGPFFYCFRVAGNYFITATYRDKNNCANTSTLQIQTFEKPIADFDMSPPNPLAGEDKVHFYNSSSGYGITSPCWFLTGNNTDSVFDWNPLHVYEAPGNYPVVLIVKNRWGCSDTVIKSLIVEEAFSLYVPDAFTPNGDGTNDVFAPKGHGIKNYKMYVFNRWGEQIFYTPDLYDGWDGTYNEQKCKPDSYTWLINLIDASGKNRVLSGTVTMLR